MQKWEYMFVWIDLSRPREANGKELPNWEKGPNVYAFSNQLGEEGWELVSNVFTEDSLRFNRCRLIFKRPKP